MPHVHSLDLPTQVQPPTFELAQSPFECLDGPAFLAVPVLASTDGPIVGSTGHLGDQLDLDLTAVLEFHGATGSPGEVILHPVLDHELIQAVCLVGIGESGAHDFRRAGAALGRTVRGRDQVATTITAGADDAALRQFVIGLTLGSFEFHWRSSGPKDQPVRRVLLAAAHDRQSVLERAVAVAGAGWRARTLATVPSNVKNPAWLAEQAAQVAAEAGLKVEVWDESRLAEEGFGGILAVGRASASPPRMIRLDYTPTKPRGHVVLVGKGITFDTGGLSIKPADSMVTMKRDMTGGAVVIATMAALASISCPVKVTGLVASAENAVSGDSFRPGDVITHFGGRTTEVTNTDAEGRLVLADAMAYAVATLKPDVLVDVATLTGAMKVALGLRTGGFFANNETLASAIRSASAESGEQLWRMPLLDDYADKLASKVADADNGAGGPGAITAALFLQHFAGAVPWAHLDVASVGDAVADVDEWTTGPTGFGSRVLLQWLERDNPLEGLR